MIFDSVKDRIFFAKYSLFRSRSPYTYKKLLQNQDAPHDLLRSVNWKKRKCLVDYAYARIPFYQSKFDKCGFAPDDLQIPCDWAQVPLLTRSELRNSIYEILLPGVRQEDIRVSSTGGSTGKPVKVFHDRRFPMEVLGWRMLGWWGLNPAVDAAFVWRETRHSKIKRLFNALLWWPTRRIKLDASAMSSQDIRNFIKKFNSLEPKLLQGYVGAVDALALYAESHHLEMHAPQAIWLTSSPISNVQRNRIERVFRAPVYDQYGCGEVFWLAAQCKERGGLHIFSDARHVEVVDDEGIPCAPGEYGRIVITDLENYVFPIIRYVNGDRGRLLPEPCPCGINLPLMDSVKGRITDVVRLPDGTILSGDYLTTIFDDFPEAVESFQVFQADDYTVFLRVVPNKAYEGWQNVIESVGETLRSKTDGRAQVRIKYLEQIPDDRGKTRFVISEVDT